MQPQLPLPWRAAGGERQLAHLEQDEVRAAYNAAEWLPQRRSMMQWWADYLDKQASSAGVEGWRQPELGDRSRRRSPEGEN